MHLIKNTTAQRCKTFSFSNLSWSLAIYYIKWKTETIWCFCQKKKILHKHYWHCYRGVTWWGEISCYKADSYGEKETETLLRFVNRNKLNIKLRKWFEGSFSFLSLMFPCNVWLLLFILWSLKQDQNSFICSTAVVFRQSLFLCLKNENIWKYSKCSL